MSDDSERWVQPPAGMRWASEPDDQKRKDLLYHDGRRWVDYPADAGPFITDHRYFAVGIKKPAVPEGVWISVDDAMPESPGYFVVFIPRGGVIDIQRSCCDGSCNATVWPDGWNKGQQSEISHWMKVSPPAGK